MYNLQLNIYKNNSGIRFFLYWKNKLFAIDNICQFYEILDSFFLSIWLIRAKNHDNIKLFENVSIFFLWQKKLNNTLDEDVESVYKYVNLVLLSMFMLPTLVHSPTRGVNLGWISYMYKILFATKENSMPLSFVTNLHFK